MRSFFLWHGLDILEKRGVKLKGLEHFRIMNWGKPDWGRIFERKKKEVKLGKVGVFFCGNKFMSNDIHEQCLAHSYGGVRFTFHEEIFG
mmetsp:Transcript_32746/g.29622  ORF Transcript_32746/g.29622 Transcript_32746/m.29622 type:complete len:89 (+) Transcript_32746:2659-2925(+)